MKKSFLVSMVFALALSTSGMAFAAEDQSLKIDAYNVKVSGGGGMVTPDYTMPYPMPSNVYFNVWVLTSVKPDALNVAANYNVYNKATREEAMQDLKAKFEEMNKKFSSYGKLNLDYMDAYQGYYYAEASTNGMGTQTFQGTMNVTISLSDFSKFTVLRDTLRNDGFGFWVDAQISPENSIKAEALVAENLKSLLALKKSVYESVLGSTLGNVVSLNIYSSPMGDRYDPVTGMVPVNVYADVSYSL